jgi:hypothetical protein
MKTATTVCGTCGAKISGNATGEGCPACLLETLGVLDDELVADPFAKDFRAGDLSAVALAKADDGASVPDKKKAARSGRMLGDFGDYELVEEIGRGVRAYFTARDRKASTVPFVGFG